MTLIRAPKSRPRRTAVRHVLLARPLAVLGAVYAGLLTGGMVFIQVVLVPFWRGTSPEGFRQWFATHSERIRGLMGPLGAGAGLLTAASAATQLAAGRRPTTPSLTAAAATAGVVAITLTVNEPANHRFTAGGLTDAETTDLLRRWESAHRVRVALGVLATVAATSAITQLRTEPSRRSRRP